MKNFILINNIGLKLPISDDVVFPIEINGGTKSVDEFDTGSKTTHSKEIDIEGSAVVMDFFRQFLDFGDGDINSAYLPITRIGATLFLNHEERLNGILMLKGATTTGAFTTFRVQIFNNSVDFLTLAESVKISSLPMPELSHTYNLTSIQATWDLSKDYYYGLVDKGFDRVFQRNISISSFGMYFKMRSLLKRIFTFFNIQYSSDFINNDTIFKKILIGYGGGEDVIVGSLSSIVDVDFGNTFVAPLMSYDVDLIYDIVKEYAIMPIDTRSDSSLMTINTDAENQVNGNDINITYTGTAGYTITGFVDLNFSEPIKTASDINNIPLRVIITVGSVTASFDAPIASKTSSKIRYGINTSGLLAGVNNGDVAYVTVQTTFDTIYFSATPPSNEPILTVETSLNLTLQNSSTKLEEGSVINVPSYLPDMTCAEFFRGVIKTFALEYENINGVMTIEPFDQFYKARDKAIDKTATMDREQPIDLQVVQNDQPKNISFKMAENKDFEAIRYLEGMGSDYGAKMVKNESFFAVDTKEITLPWAPVISFKFSTDVNYDDLIIPRLMKVKDGGTYEPQRGKPRICYPVIYPTTTLKRFDLVKTDLTVTPLYSYGTVQEFTPDYTLMWENPAVTFAPLALPLSTIYSKFHQSRTENFISNLARKFTAYFRLNDFDLKVFDRRYLWKIEGSYYRVVGVPDADPSSVAVSKVELIKMTKPSKGRYTGGFPVLPSPFDPNPPVVYSSGGTDSEDDTNVLSVIISEGVLYVDGTNIKDIIKDS